MPKEQINTPNEMWSRQYEDGTRGWVSRLPEDDINNQPEGTYVEERPTVYLVWDKPKNPEGAPESGYIGFAVSISEEEVLRAAEDIKRDRIARKAEYDALPDNVRPAKPAVWYDRKVEFRTGQELSRQEANNLIRVTRRARDARYGSDE